VRSSDFEWKLKDQKGNEDEIWSAGGHEFDVIKAKRIIMKSPREIEMIHVEEFTMFIELFCVIKPRKGVVYDTEFPVIVASFSKGGRLIIDGWHRLHFAIQAGKVQIPAVILTVEETRRVHG
jgi:hypothetical protein